MTEQPRTVRVTEAPEETLFDLVAEAGAGGMGEVHRAIERATGRVVAIKILKKEGDPARFAIEASTLARLHHPNVVAYAGHGLTDEGRQFLVMEWLEGESLEALLRREKLPLRRVLEIARDVAAGLAYAHDEGVVHRDLKPSNVFITNEGAKIVDFGVAHVVDEPGLTQTGQILGTPSYMAPEQARGERGVGPKVDLFAFGCVLYRCVADEAPFAGPNTMATLGNLATREAPRLRGVPRAFADLVASLLDKDPAARPRSARAAHDAIAAMLRTSLTPEAVAADEGATLHSASTPRRRRMRPILLGLAACAAGVAGYFAYAKHHHAAAPGLQRDIAARACRTWVGELARRQLPDGSFTGESHRPPTGWDTGQELAALEIASSCAPVAPLALESATHALVRLRLPGGWIGPSRVGELPSSAADAWAALALATAARHDSSARDAALDARKLLLSIQRPDGGFGYNGRDDASTYATMLAAWALLEGERLDPAPASRAARVAAFEHLRAVFRSSPDTIRAVAGFEEELLWALTNARAEAPDERGGDDVLQAGAKDVIARCALDRQTRACTKPVYEESWVRLIDGDDQRGKVLELWHPWAGAFADAVARSDVALDDGVRADLETIAAWSLGVMGSSVDALAALPEYELAEYLLATSSLAR